jgi:riboflavin synthase alpha subunit
VTTLKTLAPGARVNLEIDLVARYVARLHEHAAAVNGNDKPKEERWT